MDRSRLLRIRLIGIVGGVIFGTTLWVAGAMSTDVVSVLLAVGLGVVFAIGFIVGGQAMLRRP